MAITVTATQGGSTANGIQIRLMVLTGVAAVQNGATATQSAASGAHHATITTTVTGSRVYGAMVNGSGSATFTPDSGNTIIDDVADTTNSEHYATCKTSAATGTPGAITVGASSPGNGGGGAWYEVLPNGTVTEDGSAPAVATVTNNTTVTTAAFTPPAGALLVALVSADGGGAQTTMTVSGGGLTWTAKAEGNTSANDYAGVWIASVPAGVPQVLRPRRVPLAALYRKRGTVVPPPLPGILVRTNLLGQITGSAGTGNFTTSSFTPPNNSLLVVAGTFDENNGTTTDPTSVFVISDSGGHTWTQWATAVAAPTAFPTCTKIWTTPITAGSSITITLGTGGRNSFGYAASVVAYTNYDTVHPIGTTATGSQNGGFSGPPTPASITLNSAPAATSEVFAGMGTDRAAAGVTPGSAFTKIDDLFNGTADLGLESQVRTGTTSTTVDWVDLRSGGGALFNYAAVAVEVRAQTSPPFPFAAITQPRRLRGILLRRGKEVQFVPPSRFAGTLSVHPSSPPGAVRDANATTTTAPFSPPPNALLVAFCTADANNGNATEALTITSTGGLTWSLVRRDNGSPGATVEVWKAKTTSAPGSITVSATDSQGSVSKNVLVQVFVDRSGQTPDIGASVIGGTSLSVNYNSTVANSWGWFTGNGSDSNAVVIPAAGESVVDHVSLGGFDGGDDIWTVHNNAATPTPGTTVTMSVTLAGSNHNVAVEIIPPVVAPLMAFLRRRPLPTRVYRGRQTSVLTQVVATPPAFPFTEITQSRRTRGMQPRRAKPIEVVPPQFNPPYPFAEVVQPRRPRGWLLRRGKQVQAVPPAQEIPIPEIAQPRRQRGWLFRKGKQAQTVPPQFNPPFPFSEVVQPRRFRGLLPRRAKPIETVPPQFNPPFPFNEVVQPRRFRGLLPRRAKPVEVVPTQVTFVNPPFPWSIIAQVRKLRGYPVRRAKPIQVVPPQFNPPYPWAEVVQPRRARGYLLRRGKQSQAVAPPQEQPVPEVVQPRRIRGLLPRRAKPIETVPPQFNPPFPFSEIMQPRRLRGLLPRRGRQAVPTPVQDGPITEVVQPRRQRGWLFRRGKQVQPVPAQVILAPPVFPPNDITSRQKMQRLAPRGKVWQPPWPQAINPIPFRDAIWSFGHLGLKWVLNVITNSKWKTGYVEGLKWTIGDIDRTKWTFGLASNKWSIGGVVVPNPDIPLSSLSLEYVRVPVVATVNGQALNPTSDTVKMAFLSGVSTQPQVGDWKTASWDSVSANGTYTAQCLVGPGGTVTLAAGTWYVWIQITDNPEVPVRQVGVLQVV